MQIVKLGKYITCDKKPQTCIESTLTFRYTLGHDKKGLTLAICSQVFCSNKQPSSVEKRIFTTLKQLFLLYVK